MAKMFFWVWTSVFPPESLCTCTVSYVSPGHAVPHGAAAHLLHGQYARGQWPPTQIAGNPIEINL